MPFYVADSLSVCEDLTRKVLDVSCVSKSSFLLVWDMFFFYTGVLSAVHTRVYNIPNALYVLLVITFVVTFDVNMLWDK